MKRALILILLLAACREEVAQNTDPVPLTAEAVGHFCQMNLLEHEGPKARSIWRVARRALFFSQVRDAVAYLRLPEQSHPMLAVWVSDMGAPGATWAGARPRKLDRRPNRHYVVGSARDGGMGAPELVPFADRQAAQPLPPNLAAT
jgi:copper chaperone NosL